MQTKKEDIRKNILEVARKQFLQKGFKNTSMRKIAKEAGVVLSNIYNYYKNKDEIFCEVLSGVLQAMDRVMDEHNSSEYISIGIFTSEEYMRSQIDMFVELINDYKEDFGLLLFKSAGSSLENFRNNFIDKHTKTGIEYIAVMKKKYPEINGEISEFFIHTISSSWMSIISELVMHDLSHEALEKFIREYMEFGTAGWERIMRLNK